MCTVDAPHMKRSWIPPLYTLNSPGPQLLQTFTVHRAPVIRVMLAHTTHYLTNIAHYLTNTAHYLTNTAHYITGPQLLQTFTVHRAPVIRVMLSENHLVSVCAESNHVRSWTVTRFVRGVFSH